MLHNATLNFKKLNQIFLIITFDCSILDLMPACFFFVHKIYIKIAFIFMKYKFNS